MTHLTGYNTTLMPAGAYPYYEVPAQSTAAPEEFERRMPTFLGVAAGLFLGSVCLASSASEQLSWIPQLVGVGLSVCWLVVGLMIMGQPIRWSRPITLYMAYFIWACTGFLVTIEMEYFLTMWKTTLKVVLITFVVFQCVRTRKDFLFCCLAIGITSIIVIVEGRESIVRAAQYAGGERGAVAKARASETLLSNANHLGIFSVLVIGCGMACLMGYKNLLMKILGSLAMIAGLYLVAASGSRTAMVGLATGSAALYFYHFRKAGQGNLGRKLFLTVMGIGVLAGTTYYVSTLPFFFRLQSVVTEKDAREKEPRYVYFFKSLEVVAEHPVVGLGIGGFSLHRLGKSYGSLGQYTHSSISETLSATGLPGFGLYYGSQLAMFLLIRRTRKLALPKRDLAAVNMIMAILWITLAFGVVAVLMYDRFLWPFLGACCGYLCYLNQMYGHTAPSPAYAVATYPPVRR